MANTTRRRRTNVPRPRALPAAQACAEEVRRVLNEEYPDHEWISQVADVALHAIDGAIKQLSGMSVTRNATPFDSGPHSYAMPARTKEELLAQPAPSPMKPVEDPDVITEPEHPDSGLPWV